MGRGKITNISRTFFRLAHHPAVVVAVRRPRCDGSRYIQMSILGVTVVVVAVYWHIINCKYMLVLQRKGHTKMRLEPFLSSLVATVVVVVDGGCPHRSLGCLVVLVVLLARLQCNHK